MRGAVDIGVHQPDLEPAARQRDGEIGREGRLAHPALARTDRENATSAFLRGHRYSDLADARPGAEQILDLGFDVAARALIEPGHVEHHGRDPANRFGRDDPRANRLGQSPHQLRVFHGRAGGAGKSRPQPLFFAGARPITGGMRLWDGFKQTALGLPGLAMAGKRNPWGKPDGGEGKPPGGDPEGAPDRPSSDKPEKPAPKGPRNPWLPPGGGAEPPRRSASIEDIFKTRGPEGPRRAGGGGGGPSFRLPERPGGKSWLPVILAGVAALWLIFTSAHQIQPKEQGLVTWLGGKYSHKLGSGLNFTLPWPIQQVTVENVSEIRPIQIGGEGEKLVLTGDQNLVDLSYLVRWNIKNLEQFSFQLDDPELTIREVAESAMRASLAEQDLDNVVSGEGRAVIEAQVATRMQALLDAYRAGVAIQGVAIEKADPPAKVVDAFKDVSAAQQDANAMRNRARAYAQQVMARAQGDAAAFNQIYEEYRQAPEVTRRRLYYETMESVLSRTDKTIVEAPGVTPYLPLPEVRRRPVTPPPPAPGTGSR